MTSLKVLEDILASCVIHGVIIALVFALSNTPVVAPQETVYRVSLAHVDTPAQASATRASPVSKPTIPPAPEPVAATQQETPVVKPPVSPKEKTISVRKKEESHKLLAEESPVRHTGTEEQTPSVQAAPSAEGAPLHIGGFAAYAEDAVEQPPSVAAQAIPEYPQRARRMGVEGRVEVRLVVDESGKPQACAVYKAVPAGYFEEAALAAARKTRFIPGKHQGRPVNTLVHISFVFVLD